MVEELPAGKGTEGRDGGVGAQAVAGRRVGRSGAGPQGICQLHHDTCLYFEGNGEPQKGFKQERDMINFDSYSIQ